MSQINFLNENRRTFYNKMTVILFFSANRGV